MFREQYLKGRFARRRLTPQFVLIYGRESDFTDTHKLTEDARHLKRIDLARESEHLFTYDSLRWNVKQEGLLTTSVHDNGQFEVSWIPEDFDRLGDPTGAYYLGGIKAALKANTAIDAARAEAIRTAWAREREEGANLAAGKSTTALPF